MSFARLAERCHASGQTTGVMVHAFSRWQWARAEFAMGSDTWTGAIDALALRRAGKWQVQDRRSVDATWRAYFDKALGLPPEADQQPVTVIVKLCGGCFSFG